MAAARHPVRQCAKRNGTEVATDPKGQRRRSVVASQRHQHHTCRRGSGQPAAASDPCRTSRLPARTRATHRSIWTPTATPSRCGSEAASSRSPAARPAVRSPRGSDVSDSSVAAQRSADPEAANGTAIATWVRGGLRTGDALRPSEPQPRRTRRTINGAGVRTVAPCCRADDRLNGATTQPVLSRTSIDGCVTEAAATAAGPPAAASIGTATGARLSSDGKHLCAPVRRSNAIDAVQPRRIGWSRSATARRAASARTASRRSRGQPCGVHPRSQPSASVDAERKVVPRERLHRRMIAYSNVGERPTHVRSCVTEPATT